MISSILPLSQMGYLKTSIVLRVPGIELDCSFPFISDEELNI